DLEKRVAVAATDEIGAAQAEEVEAAGKRAEPAADPCRRIAPEAPEPHRAAITIGRVGRARCPLPTEADEARIVSGGDEQRRDAVASYEALEIAARRQWAAARAANMAAAGPATGLRHPVMRVGGWRPRQGRMRDAEFGAGTG